MLSIPANQWMLGITSMMLLVGDVSLQSISCTENVDNPCADQQLGTSYPLESNCQKYILCMGNGESVVVDCIFNAWYDPISGNCGPEISPTACRDHSSLGTSTAAPTAEIPTTTTTTELPNVSDLCTTLLGQYVAYPDNCGKYIVCASPVPIAFYCTAGYYFSASAQQCVDWEDSDCESLSPGYTAATQAPSVCANHADATLPYPEDCAWYMRCVNDNVYMMSVCANGEYYDILSGECSSNVSADACREANASPTTTEIVTTEAMPDSTTSEPEPCEGVDEGRLVPYPHDCTKFIQCEQPTPIVYDCVEGQEFSAALERCMSPWIANCTYSTTSLTTTTTQATDTTALPIDLCSNKPEDSYIPYPQNCTKYIICRDPIPVGYDCPAGTEFSPIDLDCMDPQLANCQT